jgi:hypothetical protein
LRFALLVMLVWESGVRGSEVRAGGKETRGERSDVGEVIGRRGRRVSRRSYRRRRQRGPLPSRSAVETKLILELRRGREGKKTAFKLRFRRERDGKCRGVAEERMEKGERGGRGYRRTGEEKRKERTTPSSDNHNLSVKHTPPHQRAYNSVPRSLISPPHVRVVEFRLGLGPSRTTAVRGNGGRRGVGTEEVGVSGVL